MRELCDHLESIDYEQIIEDENFLLRNVMSLGGASGDSVMATVYFAWLSKQSLLEQTYDAKSKAKLGINPKFERKVKASYAMMNNLADIGSEEYAKATPVFWHVPKSGGTTVQVITARCLGLVTASGTGAILEEMAANATGIPYLGPQELKIVTKGGLLQFVNVGKYLQCRRNQTYLSVRLKISSLLSFLAIHVCLVASQTWLQSEASKSRRA